MRESPEPAKRDLRAVVLLSERTAWLVSYCSGPGTWLRVDAEARMTSDEAASLLRVELPITANALRTAFRRRAAEEHPDKSKHPKAAERFIAVQSAFDFLNESVYVVGAPAAAKCEDGTPLTELGLGLGPTINGKPCPECRGRGYKEIHERARCSDCRIGFLGFRWEYRCRRCSGTGRFTRNGRDVGECFACSGLGWHIDRNPSSLGYNRCQTCHGTGYASTEKVSSYIRCSACDGTGEVKVLNPVLPKGLFTMGGDR